MSETETRAGCCPDCPVSHVPEGQNDGVMNGMRLKLKLAYAT